MIAAERRRVVFLAAGTGPLRCFNEHRITDGHGRWIYNPLDGRRHSSRALGGLVCRAGSRRAGARRPCPSLSFLIAGAFRSPEQHPLILQVEVTGRELFRLEQLSDWRGQLELLGLMVPGPEVSRVVVAGSGRPDTRTHEAPVE